MTSSAFLKQRAGFWQHRIFSAIFLLFILVVLSSCAGVNGDFYSHQPGQGAQAAKGQGSTQQASTPQASSQQGPSSATSKEDDPDEKYVKELSENFVALNTMQGALTQGVIGCGLGALVTVLGGGSGDELLSSCVAGGALGAIFGGIDGYMQGLYAQETASGILAAEKAAKDLEERNQKLTKLVAARRRLVEKKEKELVALEKDIATGKAVAEQRQHFIGRLEDDTKQIKKRVDMVEKDLDSYQKIRDAVSEKGQPTDELDQQIAELEKNRKDLSDLYDEQSSLMSKPGLQ